MRQFNDENFLFSNTGKGNSLCDFYLQSSLTRFFLFYFAVTHFFRVFRFKSTNDPEELTSLDEYISRMKED